MLKPRIKSMLATSLIFGRGKAGCSQPQAVLIVHANRRSQYANREYRKLLEIHGFAGSMSRTGDYFDNAVAESFFGSFKQELVHWNHYQTRYAAQQDVLHYISMFYNSH